MTEAWLSAEQIPAHLCITKVTVHDWIAKKNLPVHRVGRLWKFQISEVDEWVRAGQGADTRGDAE